MNRTLIFQRVLIEINGGDAEGRLVWSGGRLLAVLVRTLGPSQAGLAGSWCVGTDFESSGDEATPRVFPSLDSAWTWFKGRLAAVPARAPLAGSSAVLPTAGPEPGDARTQAELLCFEARLRHARERAAAALQGGSRAQARDVLSRFLAAEAEVDDLVRRIKRLRASMGGGFG